MRDISKVASIWKEQTTILSIYRVIKIDVWLLKKMDKFR